MTKHNVTPSIRGGCLENLGFISMFSGDYPQALNYHKRAEAEFRSVAGEVGEHMSLYNQALVLKRLNRVTEAHDILLRCEAFARRQVLEPLLCSCLQERANHAVENKDYQQARLLLSEKKMLCVRHSDKRGLVTCLGAEADIFQAEGSLDRAITLVEEKIQLCKECGEQRELYRAYATKGELAATLGNLSLAGESFKFAIELASRLGFRDDVSSLFGRAHLSLGRNYSSLFSDSNDP